MALLEFLWFFVSLPLLIISKPIHYWHRFRSYVYDVVIVAMTRRWYRAFLTKLPSNATVLDVGIGTATSLIANRDLLISKNIKVHGVDYDQGYIDAANQAIVLHNLQDFITTECCSIHDFSDLKERRRVGGGSGQSGPFHFIYFSGSFMIIPEKVKALQRVYKMMIPAASSNSAAGTASSGRVFFSQTFENPGVVGKVMGMIKPLFKFILTIDFGQVTYESDFRKVLAQAGLTVEEVMVVGQSRWRREVLVTAT